MRGAEEGLLLLCSSLGETDARPLSFTQFRTLAMHTRAIEPGTADPARDLTRRDLIHLGQSEAAAAHILQLLSRGPRLADYLATGERHGIFPLTRITPGYPAALRQTLGDRCPPVLYYQGDLQLLKLPCVSVVGSRQPSEKSLRFAARCGELAAKEGFVLCSGGASGVDQAAETACLQHGGFVIEFPAGRLLDQRPNPHVLYLAETSYDAPFSAQRALSRNRLIHALSARTFAAQPRLRKGGTWQGCVENLRGAYSTLYIQEDGSAAVRALTVLGAVSIGIPDTLRIPELQLRLEI